MLLLWSFVASRREPEGEKKGERKRTEGRRAELILPVRPLCAEGNSEVNQYQKVRLNSFFSPFLYDSRSRASWLATWHYHNVP